MPVARQFAELVADFAYIFEGLLLPVSSPELVALGVTQRLLAELREVRDGLLAMAGESSVGGDGLDGVRLEAELLEATATRPDAEVNHTDGQ